MKLTVLRDQDQIQQINLLTSDPGEIYEFFIGRSPDCHLVIDDHLVSRHHVIISNPSGKWMLKNLSEIGRFQLNGVTKEEEFLKEGDTLAIGPYIVIVNDIKDTIIDSNVLPVSDDSISKPVKSDEAIPEPIHTEPLDMDLELSLSDENEPEIKDENNWEEATQEPDLNEPSSVQEFNEETNQLDQSSEFNPDESFEPTSDEGDLGDSTQMIKSFVDYHLKIYGEFAPYDKYHIQTQEVYIGRDEQKCQIILNDPEVSSTHAVLKREGGQLILEDLNSSNGTILNGERINRGLLKEDDEFLIGSTSFTLLVSSDLINQEKDRLMPVEENQVVEREEIIEEVVSPDEIIHGEGAIQEEKSIIKRILKDPAKRKKALYALVGILILWILFDDEGEKPAVADKDETKEIKVKEQAPSKLQLSPEQLKEIETAYELGVGFFEQSKFPEALVEFDKVLRIDPEYKQIATYHARTQKVLEELKKQDEERRLAEERAILKKEVEAMLVKAQEAFQNGRLKNALDIVNDISAKDPNNIDNEKLKSEIEAMQREEEEKALKKAQEDSKRKAMVDALMPGKTFYLKKMWYEAIVKLDEFLNIKAMDEDLIKEATTMLGESKDNLNSELEPLVAQARALKEAQDLKSAYEAYLSVLRSDPTHKEALNEIDTIKSEVEIKAKKVYREALISESLSLFSDAKEKFQEVLQITPTDSEYYKKAQDKLKNYLE